jgi:hypothetical protein
VYYPINQFTDGRLFVIIKVLAGILAGAKGGWVKLYNVDPDCP